MRLNLLLTGNELMSGDTVDSNSSAIAERFSPQGWRIHKKVTVGDDLPLLCREIETLCQDCDVLLINGGLGPTIDDLTAEALATVAETTLSEHPQALQHLQQWCEKRGFALNSANYKQAMLPSGCDIIHNATGSAVGIRLEHQGCLILATPGVPSEMKVMLEREIIPLLSARFSSDHIQTVRLGVFGLGESGVQELFNRELPDWPDNIELGFRASMPVLEVKLTTRDNSAADSLPLWQPRVEALLGHHLLGELPVSVASSCLRALQKHQVTITCAESCTGGRIAAELTRVPGASANFIGGVVSYSNAMKQSLLGVSAASLAQHGAVSEQVVREMTEGALRCSGADIAVAVTGIAGPDGGTPDKPVGTVWIGWGRVGQIKARCLRLPFERELFQSVVAALALDLVRRELESLPEVPQLMQRYLRTQSADTI